MSVTEDKEEVVWWLPNHPELGTVRLRPIRLWRSQDRESYLKQKLDEEGHRVPLRDYLSPYLAGLVTPMEELDGLTAKSQRVLSWVCEQGHPYKRRGHSQVIAEGRCPVCSNTVTITGVNDLATRYRSLVSQALNEELKNLLKTTSSLSSVANQQHKWVCLRGHIWECSIKTMVRKPECRICELASKSLSQTHPSLVEEKWSQKNTLSPDDITAGSERRTWWKCPTGAHEDFLSITFHVTKPDGINCPRCSNSISRAEIQILEWMKELLGDERIITNDRQILKGRELDFYIPSKKIAIEYNGVYWHSELFGKDSNYHRNKWLGCRELGIQLIQIWEDDWVHKPGLVKRMLAHKLGASRQSTHPARKLLLEQLTATEARKFLDANHIQGFVGGTKHLGLVTKEGKIVAVSTWKKEGSVLYLQRYATSARVPGGLGKLLKQAMDWGRSNGFQQIVTFANNEHSDGRLYELLGFTQDRVLEPDYMYLVGSERKHKFGYRIQRFRDNPDLKWESGLSEKELASLNGLHRIWDSGKIRYKMDIKS